MPAAESTALALRFGVFELDLRNNELRRSGVLLKLTPQQFQVLRLLAANGGQLQTREEIQRQVWGADTFVDFDRNLNVCVAQIRATLNDDSDAPRFIQTVPKQGYRFIAPVEKVAAEPVAVPAPAIAEPHSGIRWWILAAGIVASFLVAAGYVAWRRTATPQRIIIAALPVENLTHAPEDDLFAAGLTEELIGQFGSLNPGRLGVIGRSSVMRYQGKAPAIDQIGRDLHVDYVVEGTVRRDAGRLRIAARLIRVSDQAQAWTGTSERDQSESFRAQEEAAAQIAAGVSEKLLGAAPGSSPRAHVHNQEAYQAYLNGLYLEHKGDFADSERGIAYFEDAARLDPQFDQAYSAEAEALAGLARAGRSAAENFPRARAAAEKALAINEANAEAHNALANVLFWREWNWAQAEQHFQRALQINPSSPLGNHDYAFFLIAMGRTEAGLTVLRRAIALDPLSPRVNIDSGWLLLQARHFEEAIRQAERARELEPGLAEANACILRSLFYQRKFDQVVKKLPAAPAAETPEQAIRQIYLQRVQQYEKTRSGDPFTAATSYAFLGETAKALDALEAAYAQRSTSMPLLKTEPALESLHSDSRFQALLRKMNL